MLESCGPQHDMEINENSAVIVSLHSEEESMPESCGPQHDMEINENQAVITSLHSEEESMPESCGPQHDREINENQAVITSLHSEEESVPESCGPQHDMEINENQDVITSLHSEEGSVAYARVETVDFVENSNLSTLSEEVPYQSFSFLSSCEEDHQSNTRLNTEEKDCNGETKQKSKQKKPNRFCTYCKTIITGGKLKRHILRKHRTETEVQSIISKPQHIQNNFFDKKRREGIYEYNVQLIGDGFDAEMRERKPVQQDQLRVCSDCKGFYSNKYFFKHKCSNNDSAPQALKPKLLAKTMDDKMDRDPGFVDILNRFRQGEIGDFCRTNKTIKLIGYKHFNLRRHEEGKQDEVRKIIMAEMRELSKLFFCFKNLSSEHCTVEDLFRREHLPDLIEALQQVTTDKQEKHGQKLFLDAVLLRSVKTLEGYFAQTMQDEKKKELKNFKSAYKSLSHELFPSARQKCIKNSLEKNRKPANLPNEQKVIQIKEYIAAEIPIILKDYTVKNFAWLRSLVVARLTLFNARRGEEASRLLISEWEEAEKGVWLPDEELEKITDPAEQYLLGQFKLAYLKGKGKKYVPILIPNDLLSAIQVIKRDRFLFGIREENPFLFATKIGLSHCSGWHAVAKVCAETGIHIITATKMRHRLSCIYASLDMSAENQKIFLQHMGHEERINKENYQCPLGVRTACVMGRMLRSVDEGSVSSLMEGACPKAVDEHEERVAISQGSVSSLVEGACLKAVGEHEEHDAISQDHPFETNDTDTTTCRKKKERSNSVKWSKEETKLIRDHFQGYIFTRSDKNTGNLPSKKEIEEFLETNCIKTLKDLDKKTQSFKMKTKIFNERKMTRERATRRLQDLKSRD
ncbi:uncharacterized protein LOC133191225 [Saccostrea echinata]|uniref:uncharacterized protein LOC133191225 n=1 Tax=Saccostrea echinata TaxID=191078 RepID=UPI002A8124A4|nr:uncharacterized protein LOC133191225 [Saccostrea echinata]